MPFIFRIDVEPDAAFIDRDQRLPWIGFERGVEIMRSMRERIAATTGSPVRFVWKLRMDPQIGETYGTPLWVAEQYAPLLRALVEEGDEIGLHVHAFRWLTQERQWCEDLGNQEWVDHCVRVAFGAYRQAFGRHCAVVSMGSRWLNNATVHLLEAIGAQIDLTVEPGHPAISRFHRGFFFADDIRRRKQLPTADLPDYLDSPRYPYRPSLHDFRNADPARREGIWMMPLTSAVVPRDRLRRIYDAMRGLAPGIRGHVTLVPVIKPDWFRLIVDAALRRHDTAVLAMALRSHVFARADLFENVRINLDWLLKRRDIGHFAFSSPTQALVALGLDAGAAPAGKRAAGGLPC